MGRFNYFSRRRQARPIGSTPIEFGRETPITTISIFFFLFNRWMNLVTLLLNILYNWERIFRPFKFGPFFFGIIISSGAADCAHLRIPRRFSNETMSRQNLFKKKQEEPGLIVVSHPFCISHVFVGTLVLASQYWIFPLFFFLLFFLFPFCRHLDCKIEWSILSPLSFLFWQWMVKLLKQILEWGDLLMVKFTIFINIKF